MNAQDLQAARATFAEDIRQRGRIQTAALIEGLAIHPESSAKFFFKAINAQITFVAAAGQPASSLILHQGGHDIAAPRIG